jgi:hypothetical protein
MISGEPIVLSAIVGASVSFLVVVLSNLIRESFRQRREASERRARGYEIWE